MNTILLEKKEDGLWLLTLNRPEAMNALNTEMMIELGESITFLNSLSVNEVKCLIITGSGEKAFVAGADIKELTGLSKEQALEFSDRGQKVFHSLETSFFPIIAAVNGFALGGGCELALACDFIYASDKSKMGLPESTLGLIPGFGGSVRLLQAVGIRRARELTYTGSLIDSQEAYRIGLVNKVFPSSELLSETIKTAQVILSRGPLAQVKSKKSMIESLDLNLLESLKNESLLFSELFETKDMFEGTQAFIEKRKPQFKGH